MESRDEEPSSMRYRHASSPSGAGGDAVLRVSSSSAARPGHADRGAVALDDDIRSVGCRVAKGTDVGHVFRVRLRASSRTGQLPGRGPSPRWFPEVESPDGRAEGAPNLMGGRPEPKRPLRWSWTRRSGDDRRSLREIARSREETTRLHQAGGCLGWEDAMVQPAKGEGGSVKPHERIPFEVDTLKISNTPRRVARIRASGCLGARR